MKATKYINSKGFKKGVLVYSIKKNGERYKNPTFYEFVGNEKTVEDVIKRLVELNPTSKFESAEN